jgi:hypothetical protein
MGIGPGATGRGDVVRFKLLIAVGSFGSIFATEAECVEVKFDNQGCYSAQVRMIQHADGFLGASIEGVNIRLPDQYGNPMWSGHCVGSLSVVAGEADLSGQCEFTIDASGTNRFLVVFSRKGDPATTEGTMRFVHGTGKFSGISGEGKFKAIGEISPPGDYRRSCRV